MHGSKRIGIEMVVKNNGDWIIKELWYSRIRARIDVWRIGLSEHTKEEENLFRKISN